MQKQFYKTSEVCELLACGRSQLYRWLSSGELKYCKLAGSRSTRIPASAIEEFVARQTEVASRGARQLPKE